MAFTEQNKADAYLFFVLAFNAAPGTVYGGQIVQAYEAGMTTADIVAQYVDKPAFTAQYPATQTPKEFATALVGKVASLSTSATVKAAAVADIEKAMAAGWTKAQVVTQILGNLATKTVADADWGTTVAQLNNKVAVAKALTEGPLATSSTDAAVLQGPLAKVTEDVATVKTAINGAVSAATKIEALAASKKAVADFAKALDLNADGVADGATTADVQTKVDGNVTAKAAVITTPVPALVTGWASSKTAAENTALVAAQKAANDAAVVTAKANVTAKITAATTGADAVTTAQIAQYKALEATVKNTTAAALVAKSDLDGATAKLATLDSAATPTPLTGVITGYTKLNDAGTTMIVDPALTDATKKAAATAYASAFNADKTAKASADTAATAKDTFAVQVLQSTAGTPVVAGVKETAIIAVIDAEAGVATAEKKNPAIDKAVADYAAAVSLQTALKGLTDAVVTAEKAFTDAGLALPVEVSTTALVATAGDDIYLVGTANGSISGFGVLGKDGIFAGKDYTVNADITKGDDAKLEVFFKTNGTNTDVYVEQKAFGSNTADAAAGNANFVKITLTGVAADKLALKDGFVVAA